MAQEDEQDNFYVDIPDVPTTDESEGSYKNVATFHSYAEAVEFAATAFGADEEGRVELVSGGSVPLGNRHRCLQSTRGRGKGAAHPARCGFHRHCLYRR